MAMRELQRENERLRMRVIDETRYTEWSVDEVVRWIVSIRDAAGIAVFVRYEERLEETLVANELTGDQLGDLEKRDLIDFGISVFKHRTLLMDRIRSLVGKGKDNEEQQSVEMSVSVSEGAPTAYI